MRVASLRMAVLALSFVAARAEAQGDQPPPEVVAEIVRGHHDRGFHRCQVRLRVLSGDRFADEFDAEVACYTFMLHQLQRRGRAFHVRISPQRGTPAHEVEIVGAEIFGGPR